MSIKNPGWKWSLVLLVALVFVGLSLRHAQPALAQGWSNVSIMSMPSVMVSTLGSLDVDVKQGGGTPFAVRLDQGPEKGLPVRIEGPLIADSAAIAVDVTSVYVVKGNKVFLLDKKTLKILKTLDLPTSK